jgi:hypothetical protein
MTLTVNDIRSQNGTHKQQLHPRASARQAGEQNQTQNSATQQREVSGYTVKLLEVKQTKGLEGLEEHLAVEASSWDASMESRTVGIQEMKKLTSKDTVLAMDSGSRHRFVLDLEMNRRTWWPL